MTARNGEGVYVMPNIVVAGTVKKPDRYAGSDGQARLDWAIGPHAAFAVELDHFIIGDVQWLC
jgi:hypothetical protein